MVRIQMKLAVVVATALVLSASVAFAQNEKGGGRGQRGGFGGFGGFGGGMGGMMGRTFVLANEKVQQELELADDQIAEIKKINEELGQKQAELFGFGGGQGKGGGRGKGGGKGAGGKGGFGKGGGDFNPEEFQKRMAENNAKSQAMQKEALTKIDELLLPNQVQRSKEILWQLLGLAALQDEEVAEALAISADQKSQFEAIQKDVREKASAMFQGGGFGFGGGQDQTDEERKAAQERRQAMQKKMEDLRKESEEKTLAVLTDEQKTKFEELKGEAFAAIEELRNPFGGRGGPGGRRGKGQDAGA